MSEKPLTPWAVAENTGKIIAGHCDCMVGLGETCSHVASLLWTIEAGVRKRDTMTVTDKKAYWVMPPAVKQVPYEPVRNMKFDKTPNSSRVPTLSHLSENKSKLLKPAPQDVMGFFNSLATCKSKPAILSLVESYSDDYVPKCLDISLPKPLTDLYDSQHLNKNYSELLKITTEIDIHITTEQIQTVEEKTRGQANSRLWFRMRTGRITASRFKSCCTTNPASPALSTIMAICHPELSKFKSAATHWGCEHELVARTKYESVTSSVHKDFEVSDCGLFISSDHPFLGASPDGLVNCSCCGAGVCEIKVV